MAQKTVVTLAEVRRARAFLKSIGGKATTKMIVAVAAFFRVEHINTNDEVRAAAKRLLSSAVYTPVSARGPRGDAINKYNKARAAEYKAILQYARAGDLVNFLYSIALSRADSNHYGGYYNGTVDPTQNELFKAYDAVTGVILTPPTPAKTIVTKGKLPIPPIRDLPPPPIPYAFIDPGAAGRFYADRHQEDYFLPDD